MNKEQLIMGKLLKKLGAEQTEFTNYLESKNISLSTIKKYIRQVERFKTFVDKDLEQVSKKDILNYLQFLEENKNLSNRSKQQILGILKHYYNHLEIPNPTNLIKIRGTKRKILYKVLSIEELNEFADLYFYQNEDKRNYLILSLCMYQGFVSPPFFHQFVKLKNYALLLVLNSRGVQSPKLECG